MLTLANPLRFSGLTREKTVSRAEWASLLPKTDLDAPVAALDLGGNAVKLLVLQPDYTLHYEKKSVQNGKSIGRTGTIGRRAKTVLYRALKEMRHHLDRWDVQSENIRAVATAGLRSATNGEAVLKRIRRQGLPFEIISYQREAALVYPSVLLGEGIRADEKIAVVEIGGGSTELAFGTGPDAADDSLSRMLEIGTGRLNLDEPFVHGKVRTVRKQARAVIRRALGDDQRKAVRNRRVFIESADLDHLRALHLARTGKDLLFDRLTRKDIGFYLSCKGLDKLRRALPEEVGRKSRMKIVTKLVILDELMTHLGIPQIELGFDGGLKFAVLKNLLEEKQRRAEAFAVMSPRSEPELLL